jgi:DNA helicase-2/ATP-dependent DNA helicase PcrA
LDVLEGLSTPQREAVTHVEGPLLVLAAAGSGKTRVITRRLAYLTTQGVSPRQLLSITFTNKAAGEMKRRVEEMGLARGATVCTFHSLCARLLREFASAAGMPPAFSILDRDDQLRVVKEAMKKLEVPVDRFPPGGIHAGISRAKNNLHTPQEFEAEARDPHARRIAAVYKEYERLLAASSALDFDDLLVRMVRLMRDRPEVRQTLGERFRFVQVDEYQDTNRAQYYIAHGIAMDHHNLCVTGDPDQSIYGWRGADIRNILDFQKDYPAAKVVRLEENYRSTAPILLAAGTLIARNRQRQEKKLWTSRAGGSLVRVVICDDEHAEAREVARRIQAFHSAGRAYGDVAVFYRVNSLSRVLEEGMRGAAIPYQIARGVEFYNRKEIKDALAYLKLMVNPSDDVSCVRVINTPARGIGQTTLLKLRSHAEAARVPLLEACRLAPQFLPGATGAKVAAFADLVASLSAGLPMTVRETVEKVIEATGLESPEAAKERKLAEPQEEGAQSNLEELVSAAAEFDNTSEGGTLADWLLQVSLISDVDHFEGASGAVTLMTLHAAKGLEFPAVFIVGCEMGLLPFQREQSIYEPVDDSRLEEERRLAFVGMTRAKEELVLLHARSRMVRGKTMPQAASQFLAELGGESVRVEDVTTQSDPAFRGREGRSGGGYYEDVSDRAAIEETGDSPHFPRRKMGTVPGFPRGKVPSVFGRGQASADRDMVPDADAERAVLKAESQAEHEFPPEYEYLKVGSPVTHPQFGRGKVVALRQPWPETRAEIVFERVGKKTLVLAYAKLRVGDD